MLPSLLCAAAQNPAARNSQSELVCAANAQDHDVDGPRSTFDAQYHHHQDYLGRREQGAEAARAALDTTSVGTRTGCKCNTSPDTGDTISILQLYALSRYTRDTLAKYDTRTRHTLCVWVARGDARLNDCAENPPPHLTGSMQECGFHLPQQSGYGS